MQRESEDLGSTGETVPANIYDSLARKHVDLQHEHEDCLMRLERAEAKLRKSKSVIRLWQAWYDAHPKYVNAKTGKTSSVSSDQQTPSRSPKPGDPGIFEDEVQATSGDGEQNSAGHEQSINDLPVLPERHDSDLSARLSAVDASARRSVSAQSKPASFQHTSSQTTEGETEVTNGGHPTGGHSAVVADEDDEPIVTGVKTVRHAHRHSAKSATTPSYGSPFIKQELASQVPLPKVPAHLSRAETSDLDTVNKSFETPRKRRRTQALQADAIHLYQSTGSLQSYDTSETAAEDAVTPSVQDSRSSGSIIHHTSRNAPEQADSRPTRRSAGPLTPISGNTRALPRTSNGPQSGTRASKKHKKGEEVSGVYAIAEDGSEDRPSAKRKDIKLQGLLEGEAPESPKKIISPRPPITARKAVRSEAIAFPPAPTFSKGYTPNQAQSPRRQGNARADRDSPLPINPDDEPLRSRPVQSLELSDFKINPRFAGTDYAFVEPTRAKAARSCLPGCTRPECCGEFLQLARANALPEITRSKPLFPTASQDTNYSGAGDEDLHLDDDSRYVLREHLGPDYRDTYRDASPGKREKLKAEALAQHFADRNGKHRNRFERRRSPPGYWRTDMPTTQEEEDDRVQAKRLKMEKVEERWRSAKQPGGRWMFRDE